MVSKFIFPVAVSLASPSKENSISSIHGYDPELKVQVRLKGKTSIHVDDEISKKIKKEVNWWSI